MLLFADVVEGLLRQCEADKDRLYLRDRDERGVVARAHEIALVDEPRTEPPVDRRTDVGVAEVELGSLDLRFVALDRRLQLGDQRLLLVIALPGLAPGADELLIPFEIDLGAGQLRLVLLLCCLRLLQRRLIGRADRFERAGPPP